MANTGLLILTNPAKFKSLLPMIKNHVSKTLYIQYFPERNVLISGNYSIVTSEWKGPRYAPAVVNIYSIATAVSSRLDIRVLLTSMKNPNLSVIHTKKPIEIVIFDQTFSKKEADTFIQDCLANTSMGCSFVTYDDKIQEESKDTETSTIEEKTYKNVVLGGTFDRLHNGHKILLSEAVLRCTEKLTVGVTDTNMLSGKLLWELIEPCAERIAGVKDFLEDVDTSLTHNIVPIQDMYGPTKDDPTLEMIVVSEETKRGGEKVNELRLKNNLNELDIYVVKLVHDEQHLNHEESKISSSNHRIRLLGTRLKTPRTHNKPLKPYIIGLTGGMASGKSSVADKLQKLGAAVIDCDKLGHELSMPGGECYKLIIENFGTSILHSDGTINRKALASIVFSSQEKLNKLNMLAWPVILQKVERRIKELHAEGFEIIVVEAAVLIQAKWQDACHEIWTCIIPQEEAVKRIVERNILSEQDAKLRLQAQPTNMEQVKEANVVICTLWSTEVTQSQVQKAWNELQDYLSKQSGR